MNFKGGYKMSEINEQQKLSNEEMRFRCILCAYEWVPSEEDVKSMGRTIVRHNKDATYYENEASELVGPGCSGNDGDIHIFKLDDTFRKYMHTSAETLQNIDKSYIGLQSESQSNDQKILELKNELIPRIRREKELLSTMEGVLKDKENLLSDCEKSTGNRTIALWSISVKEEKPEDKK